MMKVQHASSRSIPSTSGCGASASRGTVPFQAASHQRTTFQATRKAHSFRKFVRPRVQSSALPDEVLASVEDPVLRAALKEPSAFLGGVFAGALGLDVKEDPLRSWVERTTEQAGLPTPPVLSPSVKAADPPVDTTPPDSTVTVDS